MMLICVSLNKYESSVTARFKARANTVYRVPRDSWLEADGCFYSEAKRKLGKERLIESRWYAWRHTPLTTVPAPEGGGRKGFHDSGNWKPIIPPKDRWGDKGPDHIKEAHSWKNKTSQPGRA